MIIRTNAQLIHHNTLYVRVVFADGVFRDLEELLVYGHHSSHASENKHAAIRVENRRGRHTTSGVQFEEREPVAGHVHGNAATGNYRGGGYNLEPMTYGTALGRYTDNYFAILSL